MRKRYVNPCSGRGAATAWFASKLEALIDDGVDAFKTDFGERIPVDVEWADGADPQWQARRVVEDLGLALQGSLLVRHAPPAVADAFCASRLVPGARGYVFGDLPSGIDADAILARALAV